MKDGIPEFAALWVELEGIMLSEDKGRREGLILNNSFM